MVAPPLRALAREGLRRLSAYAAAAVRTPWCCLVVAAELLGVGLEQRIGRFRVEFTRFRRQGHRDFVASGATLCHTSFRPFGTVARSPRSTVRSRRPVEVTFAACVTRASVCGVREAASRPNRSQ